MGLILVRHGEIVYNREGRVHGGLIEQGLHQARAAAQAVRGEPLAAIYTSPMARAGETARIIAEVVGLIPEPLTILHLSEDDEAALEVLNERCHLTNPGDAEPASPSRVE